MAFFNVVCSEVTVLGNSMFSWSGDWVEILMKEPCCLQLRSKACLGERINVLFDSWKAGLQPKGYGKKAQC